MAKVISLLRKLGLVHSGDEGSSESASVEPEPRAEPQVDPKPAPRVVRLPSTTFDEALADEPEAVPIEFPFEEIYAKAGVVDPEHGFTVYKLMEMLATEEIDSLAPEARAKVIPAMLGHLPGGGVPIEEIAQDAARRDRALDAFEEFLGRKVADTMVEVEAENEELQREIDRVTEAHRAKIEANLARLAEERRRFDAWRIEKRKEEARLHAAIEPFVTSPEVTVEGSDPTS